MNIISFEDFLKEENAILIDVRTPKEFLLEKIPNSVNIPVLLDEERVCCWDYICSTFKGIS